MKGKIGRHLYHLFGGCVLPLLALVLERYWLLLFVGTVAAIFVVAEVLRFRVPSVNRRLGSLVSGASEAFKEREAAKPIGSTYLLVGSFVTFLFFPRDIAIAALFFTAVGDASAAIVGERIGRRKVGNKSLEGFAAFVVSSAVVGGILLLMGLQIGWIVVIAGALVAALVELMPLPLDDNFTIPVVSAAAMSFLH